ncbi:PD40 domain-containing protein, partial [bacterium]|nr:PD40 domain-containing protein [bacterium]
MRIARLASLAIAVLASCAFGGAKSHGLAGAKWVWSPTAQDGQGFPGCVRYFRGTLTLPDMTMPESAELIITADNLYTFYINGVAGGESTASPNDWSKPKRFDVTAMLAPGKNVLAIEAINTVPGPAGLIAKFTATLPDDKQVTLVTNETWIYRDFKEAGWEKGSFDDSAWEKALAIAPFGGAPWGSRAVVSPLQKGGGKITPARKSTRAAIDRLADAALHPPAAPTPRGVTEVEPPKDFVWPEAVVFIGEDCSLDRPHGGTGTSYDSLSVTIFNPRKSRAFPEHDLPAPMKVGKKLFVLAPARPDSTPKLLLDAGKGGIGSLTASYDGRSIYMSMAYDGEPFFHIYRVPAAGGKPVRLTDGPFHDIDPAELPDGRIVFTSTRIGRFEEYHNPPSRALFTMNADGANIRPLTHTFIFDNEPEVMADGRILFIRSDNFFDRGKVETLLHAIHPDGSAGYTEFGLDVGPEYGGRLRAFYCGSPAPMPDGRVAYLTGGGIAIGPTGGLPGT